MQPSGSERRTGPADLARWRRFWEDEIAGAALYRSLAEAEKHPEKRDVLRRLASFEERHAAHWEKLLRDAGVTDLRSPKPPARVRMLAWLARRFGAESVLPIVLRLEAADAAKYDTAADAAPEMAGEERGHGRTVSTLLEGTAGGRIAEREGRHRVGAGGALRAAVFGVNDGLVSNLSLVMGVAGGVADSRIVLLAGVAGLLAGAFSMAAGEWVSVRSQRELFEREIEVEREELELFPEEEREELALIYRAKGIPKEQADSLAAGIMARPDVALDTLAREELGLAPDELGSPWVASSSSFVAFALGAVVPVLPFVFASGAVAIGVAAGAAACALAAVGAAISLFTGRSGVRGAARMLAIGTVAAAATFGLGRLLGVTIS